MVNQTIRDRLEALRAVMERENIDFYMMPTADFHNSEYVNEYFKVRKFFSNFSGSNGTLLVWRDGAGLWTDGRYFIQAEKELAGTGITLFRMQNEGVPTLEEFLQDNLEQGQTLGFDGRVIPAAEGKRYEKLLKEKEIRISYEEDLADRLWTDRPAFPAGRITVLEEKYAGKSVEEKLAEVRSAVGKAGAEGFLLSKLDDLMWLYNIRGCDVECNPVAMSYSYITEGEAVIFLQSCAVGEEEAAYFAKHHIAVREYGDIVTFLKGLPAGRKILLDPQNVNYCLYRTVADGRQVVEGKNPTALFKAVKNPTELSNMAEVYLQDSVAVTKFIYWLKTHIGKEEITELSAAEHLEQLRRSIPGFLDLSFPTIAGYKENAAMMHYSATPENFATLAPEGMLLVDSGGQYLGGTTDVTRTIVLGPVSDEIKKHYTLVAASMLQVTNAKWLYGCTGRNLDILAREPLWEIGLDYKCGTGHGVGYMLNVHEGPQGLRWQYREGASEAVLEAGMDVTNEPGVYVEGSHGIRIENVMVVRNGEKNEYGQFVYFDTLTYAPIDRDAIDVRYLSPRQRDYLNAYHRKVYEKVAPCLTEAEREWLKEATAEI